METHQEDVERVRSTYGSGRTKSVMYRRVQLVNLLRLYEENTEDLISALENDLRKPKMESYTFEIELLIRDVKSVIKKLNKWTRPKHVSRNLLSLSDKVYCKPEPHGVVLIIAPWNYPLHLAFLPFHAAIAAGNCVIVKPSELSAACSKKMAELIPKYLDTDCYKVITGGPNEAKGLLGLKFDYIFYTGSGNVGKIVYNEASKTLTPVCLELGGKCPVYVDDTANLRMTAQRIIWGKLVCLGQTCVAPDYILCNKEVEEKLVEEFKSILSEFFPNGPQDSSDLCRIINNKHFTRLRRMINESKGKIVIGGAVDEYDLWIEPTVIVDVDVISEPCMQEEIFGPILPIIRVKSVHDVVRFVNARPEPIVMYIFSKNQEAIKKCMKSVSTGGVTINDCVYQKSIFEVPFGGVGASGLGQYHGKYSFNAFSRPRAVVHRNFFSLENKYNIELRYPPYSDVKLKLVNFGLRHYDMFYLSYWFNAWVRYSLTFILGLFVMYMFTER